MITTIIFDFGDIFINLRQDLVKASFQKFGLEEWDLELLGANHAFEKGKIAEDDFLSALQKRMKHTPKDEIRKAWNSMLGDFPEYRLEFLETLSKKYRLFLLSNTDAIHIHHFETREHAEFISRFRGCFEEICFSFRLSMRKPDLEIFEYMISRYQLDPAEILFVDDRKDNTDAAARLGLKTWQLLVGKEDVVDLFKKGIPGI